MASNRPAAARRRAIDTTFRAVRVLVVDDEVELADAVARGLRRDGYAVDVAHDGAEAIDKLTVNDYDLVCLDVTMPGVDGREVCRQIRTGLGLEPPPRVLMLTARDALEDRVAGLDDGADDYLVKPFAFPELLARVRSLLRREAATTTSVLIVGDLRARRGPSHGRAGRGGARPHGQGVRPAALLHGARRPGPVPGDAARACLGRARRPVHQHRPGHGGHLATQAGQRGEDQPIDTVVGRGYRLRDGS